MLHNVFCGLEHIVWEWKLWKIDIGISCESSFIINVITIASVNLVVVMFIIEAIVITLSITGVIIVIVVVLIVRVIKWVC